MDDDIELKKILDKKLKEYLGENLENRKKGHPYIGKLVNLTPSLFNKVLNLEYPLFVDFWAAWCAPCRAMEPVIHLLMKKYSDKMIFGKVNVDHYPDIAARYMVMSIPTFIIFYNSKPVERLVGAQPKAKLERIILKYIS
jgi:thioredoxin 1